MPVTVWRGASVMLAAGLCLLWGASARAESPRRAQFTFVAPKVIGCPAAEQIQRDIIDGLGVDPFRPEAELHLSIAIHPAAIHGARGLVADVALTNREGESLGLQTIRSQTGDCRVLSSAATLAARMILEPEGPTEPAGEPADATAVPPDGNPAPTRATPVVASASPTTSPLTHTQWVFSLGPIGAVGASLGPNLGAMAAVELRWRELSLGVDFRADLPDSASLSIGGSEQTSLIAGGLAPCRHFGPLAACALIFLGREQASGLGLLRGQTLETVYAAAGARVQAELWVSHSFGLSLAADLWVPFARTQTYASSQPAWSTPPASGVLWLAAESRIF